MYLIYIDESGKPSYNDPENYILSAVIVHETDWEELNDSVKALKKIYFPNNDPENIEFHTTEIMRAKGSFKKLSKDKRYQLMKDIADIISNNGCTLISVGIQKTVVRKENQNSNYIELWAWRLLFERLEQYLNTKNPVDAVTDYGLITMDSENPHADDAIRQRIRKFRLQGSHYVDSYHLIEDPYFVSSNEMNLVQLADFVAWTTRRILRTSKNNVDILAKDIFQKIIKNIYSKNGRIEGYGLKIFPKK